MRSTAAALNLFCFAAATTAELPLLEPAASIGMVAATAPEDEVPALDILGVKFRAEDWVAAGALAKAPLDCSSAVRFAASAARPERPESVSRFRRCRSARMSAACW